MSLRIPTWPCLLVAAWPVLAAPPYMEVIPVNHPAIGYDSARASDPIAKLRQGSPGGSLQLQRPESGTGFLAGLLSALGIPVDSQMLVFSRTSFQAKFISPANPRAIYFNDTVTVGYVPGAPFLEIAAIDPAMGPRFYTLSNQPGSAPILAKGGNCLGCHHGAATLGVPGIFIGSVYPNAAGTPSRAGAIITDYRTPYAERWGGWYVTAQSAHQDHRGNALALDPADPESLEVQRLPKLNPARYLSAGSDVVALLTYEHQTLLTNLLTRLIWAARAQSSMEQLNPLLDEVAAAFFYAGEAPLPKPVVGASTFAESFQSKGIRDAKGRSLRDFDLGQRLFRYPLSYLIYSELVTSLPRPLRGALYARLAAVLTGSERSTRFAHLTASDRMALREIVEQTAPAVLAR